MAAIVTGDSGCEGGFGRGVLGDSMPNGDCECQFPKAEPSDLTKQAERH
jgi:hypothetical protein